MSDNGNMIDNSKARAKKPAAVLIAYLEGHGEITALKEFDRPSRAETGLA